MNTTTQADYERMQDLTAELRCLVCQNQTIADSNAGLAIDLRQQIIEQIHQGRSDAAIKQYMVDRYGEFILYDPPFNINNAVLWLGPFLLLLVGVLLTARIIRKNKAGSASMKPHPAEQERLRIIEQRYKSDSHNLG